MPNGFLPISRQELIQDGITQPDFVYVSACCNPVATALL